LHEHVENLCKQEFIYGANQRIGCGQPLNVCLVDLGEDGNVVGGHCRIEVRQITDVQGQVSAQVDHFEFQEQLI